MTLKLRWVPPNGQWHAPAGIFATALQIDVDPTGHVIDCTVTRRDGAVQPGDLCLDYYETGFETPFEDMNGNPAAVRVLVTTELKVVPKE